MKYFGYMPIVEHEAFVSATTRFEQALGQAAKAAGVPVALGEEVFEHEDFSETVFVIGSHVCFSYCRLRLGKDAPGVYVGPNAHHVALIGVSAR